MLQQTLVLYSWGEQQTSGWKIVIIWGDLPPNKLPTSSSSFIAHPGRIIRCIRVIFLLNLHCEHRNVLDIQGAFIASLHLWICESRWEQVSMKYFCQCKVIHGNGLRSKAKGWNECSGYLWIKLNKAVIFWASESYAKFGFGIQQNSQFLTTWP